mgnify:FL=1
MSNAIDHVRVAELVSLFKGGDEAAFDELVKTFQRPVFNLAYRMLSSYEEAGDATQETFVKVYRSIDKFRGEARFATWLYAVASNMCRNQRRKLVRRKVELQVLDIGNGEDERGMDPVDPGFGPRDRAQHGDIAEAVNKALRDIPDDFATAVVMKDIQGLSYEDISEAMACSMGTVKSRIARGRGMVRDRLRGLL